MTARTAGIGAPSLALGVGVLVAVVTSSVTGAALVFESVCGRYLTAMLCVLPSGACRTGDCAAPALQTATAAVQAAAATAMVRRLGMGTPLLLDLARRLQLPN